MENENIKIINGQSYIIDDEGIARPIEGSAANYVVRNNKTYQLYEDIASYVEQLKSSGKQSIHVEKSACIIARPSVEGETISVYTTNGNLEASEIGIKGHWVVSRADLNGNLVVDPQGHTNTWQISDETLKKKYDTEHMGANGFVKPKGGIQEFIQVDKDIALMLPWGEKGKLIPQTIDAGGYLNITNINDVYGIAEQEFIETYTPVDKEP